MLVTKNVFFDWDICSSVKMAPGDDLGQLV